MTTAVLVDEEDVLPPIEEQPEEKISYDVKARESRYSRFSEEFAY